MNDDVPRERDLSAPGAGDAGSVQESLDDATLRALLDTLRTKRHTSVDLHDVVMRDVQAIPLHPWWKRALDWCLRPRTVRLSPAAGALAAAAIAAVIIVIPGIGVSERNEEASAGAPTTEAAVVTRFVFIAPEASSVRLTGDFVDWDPDGIALREERATGIWTVDVPLAPGVYEYGFVLDGVEWRPDPRALSNVEDGFGRENSVVIVSDGQRT